MTSILINYRSKTLFWSQNLSLGIRAFDSEDSWLQLDEILLLSLTLCQEIVEVKAMEPSCLLDGLPQYDVCNNIRVTTMTSSLLLKLLQPSVALFLAKATPSLPYLVSLWKPCQIWLQHHLQRLFTILWTQHSHVKVVAALLMLVKSCFTAIECCLNEMVKESMPMW